MFKYLTVILISLFSLNQTSISNDREDLISDTLKNYPDIKLDLNIDQERFKVDGQDGEIPGSPLKLVTINDTLSPVPVKRKNSENSKPPEKVYAFNESSQKPVGFVSVNAVDNSKALVPISVTSSPTPTRKPVPSATAFPLSATPTPQVPIITISPYPTPFCKYQSERLCPEIACIDSGVSGALNICGCPCVPPPIY